MDLKSADMDTPLFSFDGQTVMAKVVKVIDGDSLHVVFDVSDKLYRFVCRVKGVDTPEKTSRVPSEREKALLAKETVTNMLIGKIVEVKLGEFEKYGRLLIELDVPGQAGTSLSEYLISKNLGRAYDGGHKVEW
ncbi:unnamed protein product [Phaeothamnion confervicola]